MDLIQIDTDKCQKDRVCIIECPFNILRENDNGIPELIPGSEVFCMKCGHCLAVCPTGALTLDGISPEACEASHNGAVVAVSAMEALIKNRRSVRVYKKRPVEREQVVRLLEMVRWAPTAKNLQPVHWLMVDDRDKIRELARLTIEWFKTTGTFPAGVEAWEKGEDMILRSAPLLAIAHTATDALNPAADSSIAAATLELAATSFGIGSFWAGFFMRASKQFTPIADYLNLPEDHAVSAALALGYPKFQYHRIPPRQPGTVAWL